MFTIPLRCPLHTASLIMISGRVILYCSLSGYLNNISSTYINDVSIVLFKSFLLLKNKILKFQCGKLFKKKHKRRLKHRVKNIQTTLF